MKLALDGRHRASRHRRPGQALGLCGLDVGAHDATLGTRALDLCEIEAELLGEAPRDRRCLDARGAGGGGRPLLGAVGAASWSA